MQATGLRLCGIVDEPPRLFRHRLAHSATSVCISREKSLANFPSVPQTPANRRPPPSSDCAGGADGVSGSDRPRIPRQRQANRRPFLF